MLTKQVETVIYSDSGRAFKWRWKFAKSIKITSWFQPISMNVMILDYANDHNYTVSTWCSALGRGPSTCDQENDAERLQLLDDVNWMILTESRVGADCECYANVQCLMFTLFSPVQLRISYVRFPFLLIISVLFLIRYEADWWGASFLTAKCETAGHFGIFLFGNQRLKH